MNKTTIMNFDEFTEYAKEHIKGYLPEEYQSAEVILQTVKKNNEQYTGLTVEREEKNFAPIANMEKLYEYYRMTGSIEQVMERLSTIAQMKAPQEIDENIVKSYEQIKDKLFVRLSPVEGNEAIMEDSPYQMQADMMMTYHIYVPSEDGFTQIRITQQLLDKFGVTREQLHRDAISNTPNIFTPEILVAGDPEEDHPMLVVTNTQGVLGASAIFCEGIMDKVAAMMKGDYFILPSSIHEMIAVPNNGRRDSAELEAMVKQANRIVVEPEDILSDTVYHYDPKTQIFERADAYEKRAWIGA